MESPFHKTEPSMNLLVPYLLIDEYGGPLEGLLGGPCCGRRQWSAEESGLHPENNFKELFDIPQGISVADSRWLKITQVS